MIRLTSLLILAVWAQVVIAAEERTRTTEVELGAVLTTGNTEQRNLKFRGDSTWDQELFLHTAHLDVLDSTKNGTKTAQKSYLSYQADYKLEGNHAIFGRLAYEDDRFSGYDYKMDATVGYNRQLYKTDVMSLKGAVGIGFRQSELSKGGDEDEGIVRLAADYRWVISPSATFKQGLSTEIGSIATVTRSETSVSTTIIGDLAMKVSLNVKHTSDVPVGRDKTDTETSMTLVYKF